MSIFKKIKNLFRRKKRYDVPDLDKLDSKLPPIPKEPEKDKLSSRSIQSDNIRTRLDLILTELDNIKIQNRILTERMKNIEKTLAEMRGIKYY